MTLQGGHTRASRSDSCPSGSRGASCDSSDSRPPKSTGVRSEEGAFQPLATMPEDLPSSYRRRWKRLAASAASSYRAATELQCLSCGAWNRPLARDCAIRTCPLWSVSRKIFGSPERP